MKKTVSFLLVLAMVLSLVPTAFAAEAPSVTLVADKTSVKTGETVTLTIAIDQAIDNLQDFGFNLFYNDDVFEKTAHTIGDAYASAQVGNAGTEKDKSYYPVSGLDSLGDPFALNAGTIATVTFTAKADVAANTAAEFELAFVSATDYDSLTNNDVTMPTAVTVTVNPSEGSGYTAALATNAASNEVNGGTQITVNVGVSHSEETNFNAGEIKLSYDDSLLTPDETYIKDTLKLAYKIGTGDDGKALLTIEDFGTDKNMSYTYGIPFNANTVTQDTETLVTLTSAAFQNKVDATSYNLEDATITNSPLAITIKVPMVNVTLTEKDTTNTFKTTTQKGQAYTFAPDDTANYTYSDVTATVGGQNITVTDNGDGTFTIAGSDVTGDIELTYTKKANTYDVTTKYVDEDGNEWSTNTEENAAAYNTPFKFTVDADIEASGTSGYTFTLTSVTINGTRYTDYSCAEGTKDYTIPGADISGDIIITIEKKEIPANTYTVTVDGEAAGDAAVEKSPITQSETAKITVTVDPGYTYTVTATMSGNAVEVVQADNVYTVANVTGNVVFTVNKDLDTSSVNVYEYATVQNNKIWLVIYDGTLAYTKAPTYDGVTMFWSDSYDAYCYLEIAATLSVETAAAKVGAAAATATPVDYNMDINSTGIKDAADAQVVWNMYNAHYSDFNAMEMAKFLSADLNATPDNADTEWKINVNDALVIVNDILN